jgi:hypothetical protein
MDGSGSGGDEEQDAKETVKVHKKPRVRVSHAGRTWSKAKSRRVLAVAEEQQARTE